MHTDMYLYYVHCGTETNIFEKRTDNLGKGRYLPRDSWKPLIRDSCALFPKPRCFAGEHGLSFVKLFPNFVLLGFTMECFEKAL